MPSDSECGLQTYSSSQFEPILCWGGLKYFPPPSCRGSRVSFLNADGFTYEAAIQMVVHGICHRKGTLHLFQLVVFDVTWHQYCNVYPLVMV